MNAKTLNTTTYINQIEEWFFQLIISILKPIVHFFYKRHVRFMKKNNKQKRNLLQSLCRKFILFGIVCFLGIIIAFGAGQFVQNIKAQDDNILHKYYTSVTVQPGESLWSIAEEHYILGYDNPSDYIEEVIHINHLTDEDNITSGSTLVIPYYSEEIK